MQHSAEQHEVIDRMLDALNPPPKVEQTRRADGVLEHNPDMEIPGWGMTDDSDLPAMPPASATYSPSPPPIPEGYSAP